MRLPALSCLLFALAPVWGAPPPKITPAASLNINRRLHHGKYRITVAGVLCNACTRAVVEETRKVKWIKDAEFDYEDGYLWVTVVKDKTVRLSAVRRALRLALRRLDLDTRFHIVDVQYIPDSQL